MVISKMEEINGENMLQEGCCLELALFGAFRVRTEPVSLKYIKFFKELKEKV